MKVKMRPRFGSGLFYSFGWKKNLLAIAAGLLCYFLLGLLSDLYSNSRILSELDISSAGLPFIGFLFGIWGVIGTALGYFLTLLKEFLALSRPFTPAEFFSAFAWVIPMLTYTALPSLLWYSIHLKGERKVSYPRMDTAAHVIKYYLIMLATLVIFIITYLPLYHFDPSRDYVLMMTVFFTQCLDIALIVGMPLIILYSVIRNRTITINERLVLAFLCIGVVASLLAAYLVYNTAQRLDPSLFEDYERLMATEDWSNSDMSALERYDLFWNWYMVALALVQNILLVIEILFMRRIEKKITRPLIHLSDALGNYADQKDGGLNREALKKECHPYRYGYGEVSSLTQTCIHMADDIDNYTEELRQVTAEKERIGTELDVASNIQRDMLPRIFPPFPDRCEIDIYASMKPAKEVGGDFYDYYFIDQDHLALTIADVSGKGVPAALFMVISKTLLQNHAMSGGSPKEILTYVNHQLCQNNDSLMFCTVWFGILDLRSGTLTAANAGHEYPAVRKASGEYQLMVNRHDPPLGIRDGLRFGEYEITLSPGDCIFEYTDGVTEAVNNSMDQFEEENMLATLNAEPDADPKTVIEKMHTAITQFAEDATQYDDITMLCVKYLGSGKAKESGLRAHLIVPAHVDRLDEVTGFLEEQLENADCSPDDIFTITLAAEEIFVNIAHYAYDGGEGEAEIKFSFDNDTRIAEIVFSDNGIPFDPTSRPTPDISQEAGKRPVGGLGIHIVKQMMDGVHYQYLGGKNMLAFQKKI